MRPSHQIRIKPTGLAAKPAGRNALDCAEPDYAEPNCDLKFSLAHAFVQSCRQNLSNLAFLTEHEQLDYNWLLSQSCFIASRLHQNRDYRVGAHVGIRLNNSPEYVATFFGILLAGGVAVPIPAHYTKSRFDALCELADLTLIIDNATKAGGELVPLVSKQLQLPEIPPATADTMAAMLFTSGTSGEPKAVMLSHRNLLANSNSILGYLPMNSADRTLATMPFAHALGNSVMQTHVMSGACMVFADNLMFPADLLKTLQSHRCTSMISVPDAMRNLLLGIRDWQMSELDCLRYLAVAGGRLEPDAARELSRKIRPAQLFLMYGQTEATARLAFLPPQDIERHADMAGKPIPGVELCVRNDAGQNVGAGELGMLHARGENIMLGYYQDPAATSEVLQDGWLCTGDLARETDTGYLKICGRASSLMKSQGFRFHPLEVESVLAEELPGVQVIATPIDFLGNTRLALFAKPNPENSLTSERIKQICRSTLPRHMHPYQITIVDSWPLNASKKIDRLALQKDAELQLQRTDSNRHAVASIA